jgi:cell division protein FtsI (penicillin-binding protein 3)
VKSYKLRIGFIYGVFVVAFILLAGRIIYLQVLKRDFLNGYAEKQYYRRIPFEGKRGEIYDCKGRLLATGLNCYSVFADPFYITNPRLTAKILASNLGVSESEVFGRLSKHNRFVWIKRRVLWEDKEKIKSLKIAGIGFVREEKRFYPQEELAANVLGVVNIDNRGLEGVELGFNNYLRGKNGMARVLQDSGAQEVILSPEVVDPQRGADITLTIDAQIQYWVEEYIKETIQESGAKSASIVVMDATNGEILAMANYPTFNPNNVNGVSRDSMRNRAICDMFEPGSIFKVITLMAALETGRFTETDHFFCENGVYKVPGTTLHDHEPYGDLTFTEVFKKSSNIGVGKIVAGLGAPAYYKYLDRLQIGKKTGFDLPGEVSGSLKPLDRWSKTSPYMVPIGQEVGVTLLQMARTYAVVANGGYLVNPHILKSMHFKTLDKSIPYNEDRVVNPGAIQRAKNVLLQVVADGTGKLAYVEGLEIGGKTGTAQKFDPAIGKYSASRFRASFIGFVGAVNPPIVIAVTVDEPTKSHFGGVIAAPLFKKVAQKVSPYVESGRAFAENNSSR